MGTGQTLDVWTQLMYRHNEWMDTRRAGKHRKYRQTDGHMTDRKQTDGHRTDTDKWTHFINGHRTDGQTDVATNTRQLETDEQKTND